MSVTAGRTVVDARGADDGTKAVHVVNAARGQLHHLRCSSVENAARGISQARAQPTLRAR